MERVKELRIRIFKLEDSGDGNRLIIRNLPELLIQDYSPAAIDGLARSYTPLEIQAESLHQLMLVALMEVVIAGTASIIKDRRPISQKDAGGHGFDRLEEEVYDNTVEFTLE